MNHLLIPATFAAMLGLAASTVHAGAQQGVRCPSGFAAVISDANRALVCRKTVTYERDSICPPLFNKMLPAGSDSCQNELTGRSVASIMVPPVPVPGQPLESDFKRVVSATGTDKFVATQQQFAFPEGRPVPPYIGDASKGVSCPTGHDGDKVFDGRGIRCDRNDGVPRSADCDGIVGWEWKRDHNGAEDRCRHLVTGETGPTKPEGMTKVQHNLERQSDDIGWVLNKKSGARDTWQRKTYAFPIN